MGTQSPLSIPGIVQTGPGAFTIPYLGPTPGQVTGTTTYVGGGRYIQTG